MITDEIYFRDTVSSSTLFAEKAASDETDPGWSSGLDDYTLGTIVLSSDDSEEEEKPKNSNPTSPPPPRISSVTQSLPPKIPARQPPLHQRPASHRRLLKPENEKTFTVKITVDRECKLQ